jgi:23S rRNA pseudouridine2605 synthase
MTNPAARIESPKEILLDGKPLPQKPETKLWLYPKPAGLIVSRHDPQGRPVIFDSLPKFAKNLIAVGRLDLASEGLLLLTNDGALSRTLELPQTGLLRKYRVRVFGNVNRAGLARLEKGMVVGGIEYQVAHAQLEKIKQGRNQWVSIHLTEGKNREVRILMEALGLKVNRLIRTGYGAFKLGKLKPNGLEEVPAEQIKKWL